jgi:hypothetical protein
VLLHQFFLAAVNGNPGFRPKAYSDDGRRRKPSRNIERPTRKALCKLRANYLKPKEFRS